MADRRARRGRPEPDHKIAILAEHSSKSAIDRAYDLARAGCTDPEIVAVLVDEIDGDPAKLRELLSDTVLQAQLEEKRVAGRARLKSYLFDVGTSESPTAATLQVTTWLSRQLLGHSTKGLDGEIAKLAEELDSKTPGELRDYLQKVIGEL